MGVLVGAGVGLLLPDLAHDAIWSFDESFHQAVVRHVYEHPFLPTLFPDPVHDTPDMYRDYWGVRIWLVKPIGGYWVSAVLMLFVGKVPLAYRLSGLLAHLVSALTVYALGRRFAGRVWSFIAALGLLSLPLAWTFIQGRFISDNLDVQLAGFTCAAILCLFRSIELRSLKWAALAGAATGMAILVKFVLGFTPLGVAGVLWALTLVRFTSGPRFRELLMMTAMTCLVALPWNIYAANKWPYPYRQGNLRELLMHVTKEGAVAENAQWQRPVDAVFNEIIHGLSTPLPAQLSILAGVWLLIRARKSRDFVLVGIATWLWATWVGHSLPAAKVVHHLWNATIPQFIALAILVRDAHRRLPLAFATLGALSAEWFEAKWQWLSWLRTITPVHAQSHNGGLLAGLQMVVLGALFGLALQMVLAKRLRGAFMWVPGLAAASWFSWVTVHDGVERQRVLRSEAQAQFNIVFSKTVGQALDKVAPERSVVMLDASDPPAQIERHNLLFWSNRLVFAGRDPKDYPANGFHPYLVSPVAEAFEPVAVPASAWLRAYDLTKPLNGPPPVPEGLTPLGTKVGPVEVVGYASEPAMPGQSRYAFIVRGNGDARPLKLRFVTASGPVDVTANPSALAMKPPHVLAQAPWYVLPVVGPRDARVEVLP